jgi:membrane-bound lytic murein transglycosylase B
MCRREVIDSRAVERASHNSLETEAMPPLLQGAAVRTGSRPRHPRGAGAHINKLTVLFIAGTAFSLLTAGGTRAADALPSGGLLESQFGAYVTERLSGDGFEKTLVEKLLRDRRSEILRTTLAYAIVYRETAADYSQFLSDRRLGRARDYLERKRDLMEAAERKYYVPPEIITAILMIESDFGNFRKLHRVFNVFLTLIWAGRPENLEVVRTVIQNRIPEADLGMIQERSRKKAQWGYTQLQYLLKAAAREKMDPLDLEGSWAGAFGWPQFIPSSYWHYAVDGNNDRRVRLFDEADAIFSIGNYLRSFGWGDGLSEKKKRAALLKYNNSGLYVDTVLPAADRLKGVQGSPPR